MTIAEEFAALLAVVDRDDEEAVSLVKQRITAVTVGKPIEVPGRDPTEGMVRFFKDRSWLDEKTLEAGIGDRTYTQEPTGL